MDRNTNLNATKRLGNTGEPSASPSKRLKLQLDEDIEAKNWDIACEQVSVKEYFDYCRRFQLAHVPICARTMCNHMGNGQIDQITSYAEESFMTEVRKQVWYDALEVCHMSITPKRYLSSRVLQEIVEIILNVHHDILRKYTAEMIVDNCQKLLNLNFITHPPCLNKNLRECYVRFLTSSMPSKNNTATDRNKYEHDQGILQYCLNRLEYEMSSLSSEEPIIVSYIPENMKDSIQGHAWQKERFEIFETLNRTERIQRLFAVLETVIELLQFDSAVALSRYSNEQTRSVRHNKLIMDRVLWPEKPNAEAEYLKTPMSGKCLQIIRIFAIVVHLKYPVTTVKTMNSWLNLTIQTLYSRGNQSDSDYPNIKNELVNFGGKFYDIISDMPPDSIIRIIENIEPTYMRHIVGLFYLEQGLHIRDLPGERSCIFHMVKKFVSKSRWKLYPFNNFEIKLSDQFCKTSNNVEGKMNFLSGNITATVPKNTASCLFPRKDEIKKPNTIRAGLNHALHALFVTLHAALDEIKLQSVLDLSNALDKKLVLEDTLPRYKCSTYTVSKEGKFRYGKRLHDMEELVDTLNDVKTKRKLPEGFKIFDKIELFKYFEDNKDRTGHISGPTNLLARAGPFHPIRPMTFQSETYSTT